ncbi:MAG: PQQ-binding-like beta-propeller repeat protein, partial [Planctomycetes bacterium]|nr:PQQ-binding-like beta-propeller repeat protein [Planctomycetota bacterium]
MKRCEFQIVLLTGAFLAQAGACLMLAGAGVAQAGDWPHWRGPNFNGTTDEKNLPSDWSRTENIAWSVELPGSSAATPIVCKDRIFLSGIDASKKTLLATCLDRKDGKVLWQKEIAEGINRDKRSTFAAASAVTDGKIVVFFYATGDMICYDLDGGQKWARNIQKDYGTFAFLWTFASSPTLFDGRLYLQVLQRDVPVSGRGLAGEKNESYILAMDPQTGKTLWRQIRPSKAVAESREAFSTPLPFTINGKQQLLVVGGDCLTGHDPKTG